MSDPRLNKLAGILVNYSTKVKQDDWVHIDAGWLAKPLVEEIVDHVLKAGGHPTISFTSEDIEAVFLTYADEVQLQWISPLEMQVVQQADVMIFITAPQNTRALSGIDVAQQQTRQASYREWSATFTERSNSGALRWVMSNFPCPALAQEADMSLTDYEDFVYRATFADQADPLECWQQIHDEQDRLIKWLEGKKKVTIRGPHVDLSFSIERRRFINSDGDQNMPSGEIFTGPVEDSANGWVTFTYPAINMGREVDGVYLEFERGQVVKARSEKNETFLLEMLDIDRGARYLGEFGIGTNFGITRFTKNILYDEKIGGTFHLAVGNGDPETGSVNESSIHWDLICEARAETEILVDGEVFYQDGQFRI